MALGVTYRSIQTETRVPDGIMLSYPALNLSKENYNPSILYSLVDEFVPYSFLEVCL
jgi:hormone-sensitive lipase